MVGCKLGVVENEGKTDLGQRRIYHNGTRISF